MIGDSSNPASIISAATREAAVEEGGARRAGSVPIYVAMGKGRLMFRSLLALAVAFLLLASASNAAPAARVCIGGHFHYGGSGLHRDRIHAQASAVRAWRAIQAESHGARAAANMYPDSNRIHCKRAPGNEGWRCFVRGGPCRTA